MVFVTVLLVPEKFGVSISCVNLTAVVDLNTSKMEKCDISNNFREVIIFK